ncbi:MAG: hypothetical protein LBC80_04340 [Treponema sp.]|nr:hypothetical protein [Treponema sp.]
MKNYLFNKTIAAFLTFIFILSLFPSIGFAQSNPFLSHGEIKGFNRSVIDSHFSRADREINPERWLTEARFGITQAIAAWELIACSLFENTFQMEEAKNQIIIWSNEELEKRFSQWLIERFFGDAVEKAVMNLSQMLENTQISYSWHLDDDGNILVDDKTGNPMVIRPDDTNREFSNDLLSWRNEADNNIRTASNSFDNVMIHLYPELLAYIPFELRESMFDIINETSLLLNNSIRREFENIAAREERIFTNRRTRDIWSLRRKSEDEAARVFTEKLIAETEASVKNGIDELNVRIEQAAAGTGDLALLGEEWLRLYKEQFERGLKAWEEAEERFFIRRIEWEQDSIRLFYESEEIWSKAFDQLEKQRDDWELSAKNLFEAGVLMFQNISDDFKKNIEDARREFELNMAMRIGEGTTKVKALIDMYLLCSSAAISALENINYWQAQYGEGEINPYENDAYQMYNSYLEKALEIREEILSNYTELFGTGALKDILSPDVSSADFYLDEYQIALIKARALVLYWERKTAIAEAVNIYASDLGAGRMTEAESRLAWEEAKAVYNASIANYEKELNELNSIGNDLQKQKDKLNNLVLIMQQEEDKLNQLHSEYTSLITISVVNRESYFYHDFNTKYNNLVLEYKLFQMTGRNSLYFAELEYAMKWEILEQRESAEKILNILIYGENDELLSLLELEEKVLEGSASEVDLRIRLAAIDLLSLFEEPYSGADWYSKVKGIYLSEDEKAALYGNGLNTQLYTDYLNSSQLLLNKRLEYELEAFINFLIEKEKADNIEDDEPDIPEFALLFLDDMEKAFYIHEVLTNLKYRIDQGKSYYTDDYEENLIIEYFVSGYSFFERDSSFLINYYDDYFLSIGLLEFFNEYSIFSYYIQEEAWQKSLFAIANLFNEYGLAAPVNLLPDIHDICQAILGKHGDFVLNSAQFIHDFDSCFQMMPQWIESEITNWKNALIEYIAAYAFFINIKPEKNTMALDIEQNVLNDNYDSIINELTSFYFLDIIETERINILLNDMYNELQLLFYMNIITETWENNLRISLTNEKHWRQYLPDVNLTDFSVPALVSSWEEGLLADALFNADYHTNRINDFYIIYSQKETSEIEGVAGNYYNSYFNSTSINRFRVNSLQFHYKDFANAARLYELSIMSSDEIRVQILAKEVELKAQEEVYNSIRNNYFREAKEFMEIGTLYDEQYSVLKDKYDFMDQKRFEYEKQDVIQRWASTAYLNLDTFDLENCKAKLLRAEIVLNVLSDLYNDETIRSDNSEYAALYSAYEQSFARRLKVMNLIETLNSESASEYANNQLIFINYQNSLNQLGYVNQDYSDYYLPESRNEWKIENIITVKNGRLVFSRNDSMLITGVNQSEAETIAGFFNTKAIPENEFFEISQFDEALRGLSQRMAGYFSNPDKLINWGLAREYLLYSLINSNQDLGFLERYYIGLEQLDRNGSMGSQTVSTGVSYLTANTKSLYSAISDKDVIINFETIYKNAWDSLSQEEKADLEFYVILMLHDTNDYFEGFSNVYTLSAYNTAVDYVAERYNRARKKAKNILTGVNIPAYKTMRDINKKMLERITSAYEEKLKLVNNWQNQLMSILSTSQSLALAYKESNERLISLEGHVIDGQKIVWEDLNQTFLESGKITEEDIAEIKEYWETMTEENANMEFTSVSRALSALFNWANNEEIISKNTLDNLWLRDIQNQKINENYFIAAADAYIAGTINAETLRAAAENAYGKYSVSLKNHQYNMYAIMMNNLSLYLDIDNNFSYVFDAIGEEIILLTAASLENRYNAELAAREIEWNQLMKDIEEKYSEWLDSAAQIFERGRADWNAGFQRMKAAEEQWYLNFENEYNRVENEWNEAYLIGLMDKESWLEMAADAANEASTDAFLSLIGAEGERLSRFVDTREPFGIRDAIPEAQNLMNELLQSSGIASMANAFGSLNSIASTASVNVRRGLGGASTWDANLVKTAAADLARQVNSEIADNEARKLAHNARLTANEAIKGLEESVDSANENFRRSMDNTFIFNGLWSRSGNNYVKDVIKGSTLLKPVVSKTVTVTGYENYIMEPIILKTSLEENYLASLNSIAIQGLLENVFFEIQVISSEIFGVGENPKEIEGNREQSPGKFGAHIGYGPSTKPEKDFKKSKKSMFNDEGAGELGRLMTEFTYWAIIDARGTAELSLAPWDKRIWNDDGSWFSSPSLRSVGSIACSIAAGIVSGGAGFAAIFTTALVGSASEIAFGALDVAYGYKSWDEAAFGVGKTILTSTVSGLGSEYFGKGLTSTVMEKVNGPVNTVLAQTALTGTQTLTTGFTTSLVGGITYNSSDGFGYSNKAFKAGMTGVFNNTLTSMVSTFTTSSLTAINTGYLSDDSKTNKLLGFNLNNREDVGKLNNLIGSLAGQGVDYALGNNFTMNVLNLNQFGEEKYNSGLLELNIGRSGTTMNIGTGGANVSYNNLTAAFRGAAVWNVNTRISGYIKNESKEGGNQFDAAVTLRAQYGYGDDSAKGQLWDILKGDTLLKTDGEGDYRAMTTLNKNGQKVVHLTEYRQNMSAEEQFLLAVVLGHEAHRDGIVTADNYLNTRTATLAHTEMAMRMMLGGESIAFDQNLVNDMSALIAVATAGDMSVFNDYVDNNYDSSADYWKLVEGADGFHYFEWDGKLEFDLSSIGRGNNIGDLSDEDLAAIWSVGVNFADKDAFLAALGTLGTLNNAIHGFERTFNVVPGNTPTTGIFDTHWATFENAILAAGDSGLIAKSAQNILNLGTAPQVFANGFGEITSSYGWRAMLLGNTAGQIRPHFAWDLGARGPGNRRENADPRLVAPMDGTLAFHFTQQMGIQLITSGGENESITYSHANASSIRNFTGLFFTDGINLSGNTLTGISQNMVVGVMGNTGLWSQAPHVDLIYRKNGVVQDPAIFFYQNGGRNSFPITPLARAMSGFSGTANNVQLTYENVQGMYNYLTTGPNRQNVQDIFWTFGASSDSTLFHRVYTNHNILGF